MPPKPKNTREEVVEASLQIVREGGMEALTARSLGKRLNASAASVFTHFTSMEELQNETLKAAYELYGVYIERALTLNPPFKSFGMEVVKFAQDEKILFRILFMSPKQIMTLSEVIGSEGHQSEILKSICDTFGINLEQANWLYHKLWIYCYGIASLVAMNVCEFTRDEVSEMLGEACKGFLMVLHTPGDERVKIMPNEDQKIEGTIESYVRRT